MTKSNLDIGTLKSIVCNLRERGMTFQEISDTLKSQYGVERSRQAVQSLYSRCLKKVDNDETMYNILLKRHISSLAALGYNASEITSILDKNFGIVETYNKINTRYKVVGRQIFDTEQVIKSKINDMIDAGVDSQIIKASLDYEDIHIKDTKFNSYISSVMYEKIRQGIMNCLYKTYKLTGSLKEARDLCDNFGCLNFADVKDFINLKG